jgi:hypothetical protein
MLVAGSAAVRLDPVFADLVHTDQYHDYQTPLGNCKGLYVSSVDAAGFMVRELQGGTSTLAFSYRLVARRRDLVAPRLASVEIAQPRASEPTDVPAPTLPSPPATPAPRVQLPQPALLPDSTGGVTLPRTPEVPAPLPPIAASADQ